MAYLNLDSSVSGSNYGAQASPVSLVPPFRRITPNAQSLAWLLRNVAEEVLVSSDVSRSVWSTTEDAGDWKSWRLSATGQAEHEFDSLADSNTGVKPLGSGSDYTAFLQRYGVCVALE